MLKITKHSKLYLTISGLLMAASLVLLFVWGLNLGIDFRGGSLTQLEFSDAVSAQDLRQYLSDQGYPGVIIQPLGDKELLIKTKPLNLDEQSALKDTVRQQYGQFQEKRFESIGPTIGKELLNKAYWQIGLVILGIILYIAYAFRKIKSLSRDKTLSSWRLGLATIIALLHDVLITVGIFVLLGRFRGVEVDTLFITALLTILGFSVHDTIVVFDRIRESIREYQYKSLPVLIDYGINSTLARSINTSSTLIFVLLGLLLFGGETVRYFVLALLIGVIAGTYSSIFIASPLLLYLQKKKK